MRVFLSLMFLIVGFICYSEELDIKGNFIEKGANEAPVGWVQHTNWDGFKPFAKIKIVPGEQEGEKALLIYDNASKYGACIRTEKRYPAKPGDVITISGKCKGKGRAWVGIYTYSEKGEWTGATPQKNIELTDEWKSFQFDITVPDGDNCLTGAIDITFGAAGNAEAAFSSIKVIQEKGRYIGTTNIPLKWTAFLPVKKDFTPTAEQFQIIPENLDSAKPRVVTLLDNQIDFVPFFGNKKAENCAWAFAELTCAFDREYSIGAGADWWMQYFVNGEKVIDTMAMGNQKSPFRIDNHTAVVKLKKGKNILAVKFLSGSNSAVLMLGGPNDLRALSDRINIKQVTNMDDYESDAKRLGDPLIIKDNPTPGTLSFTGQGVYTAAPEIKICFTGKTFTLPQPMGDNYFATGIRIQSFGRKSRVNSSCIFDIAQTGGSEKLSLQIDHKKDSGSLSVKVIETINGKTSILKQLEVPYAVLPFDVTLAVNQKNYTVNIISLADSSFRSIGGESAVLEHIGEKTVETGITFKSANDTPAEMVVDNYFTGEAGRLVKTKVPLRIELADTFDPQKSGWKLVFDDEFDEDKINTDKWFFYKSPNDSEKMASLDGKGNLIITTDYNEDKTKLITAGLWSKKLFKYGYFESRLRFTKQPGWWAAFWLYGPSNGNPSLDGFEIDIFEDYYNRPRKTGDPLVKEGILDHNLHVYTGGLIKSWNYSSKLPGSIDDFYVLGLKWTPFEISYYLNGKLIKSSAAHSPYESVTFDAINHAMGVSPLHAIISGQVGLSGGTATDGKFPEQFVVDYVRVYEYPADSTPQVTWTKTPETRIVVPGKKFTFEAKAEPSTKTNAQIKRVYLFDNGYLVDYKENVPYVFEIAIDKKHYDNTPYMGAGRTGIKPVLDGYSHSFSAVAQDELGNVGHSQVIPIIPAKEGNTPYQGKTQVIPGIIKPGYYDEGGCDVAYYDTTKKNFASKDFRMDEGVDGGANGIGNVVSGEWIKYTVDIAKEGSYDATVLYGSASFGDGHRLHMLIDGRPLGEFKLHNTGAWDCKEISNLKGLKLPEGKHVITLLMAGAFNFSNIEFKESSAETKAP